MSNPKPDFACPHCKCDLKKHLCVQTTRKHRVVINQDRVVLRPLDRSITVPIEFFYCDTCQMQLPGMTMREVKANLLG